ncbi:MAG: hypothetical protein WCX17_04725 [Parcubacteria group bacterium]|jgi:Flp pilus assembly protein CpaB
MNNKKIIIALVILAVIAAVAIVAVTLKNDSPAPVVETQAPITKNTTNDSAAADAGKNVNSNNSDVKGIESDLNSVSDDNFSENNLSDSEMGL